LRGTGRTDWGLNAVGGVVDVARQYFDRETRLRILDVVTPELGSVTAAGSAPFVIHVTGDPAASRPATVERE
jgi:hypothetical protein